MRQPIRLVLALSVVAMTVGAQRQLLVPAQYSTIQAAINAASALDTVLVSPGRYIENLQIQKAITVPGTLTGLALPRQCSLVVQLPPNFSNSDPTRKGRDFYTGMVETQQTNGAWTTDAAQDLMDA